MGSCFSRPSKSLAICSGKGQERLQSLMSECLGPGYVYSVPLQTRLYSVLLQTIVFSAAPDTYSANSAVLYKLCSGDLQHICTVEMEKLSGWSGA